MNILPVGYDSKLSSNSIKSKNIAMNATPKLKTITKNNVQKLSIAYLGALLLLFSPLLKKSGVDIPKNNIKFDVDGKEIVEKKIAQGLRLDINDLDNPQSVLSSLDKKVLDVSTLEEITEPINITSDELKILEALEDNDGESGLSAKDIEIAVYQLYNSDFKRDLSKKNVVINSANYDEYAKTLNLRPQDRSFSIGLADVAVEKYYDKAMNTLITKGARKEFLPRLGNQFPQVKKDLGVPMIFRDDVGNIERIFYASGENNLYKESMEFCYYPNGRLRSVVAHDNNDAVSVKDGFPANEYARIEYDENGYVTYAYCKTNSITIKIKTSKGILINKIINPDEVYKRAF